LKQAAKAQLAAFFAPPSPGCHLAKNHAIFYQPQFVFKKENLWENNNCVYIFFKKDRYPPVCYSNDIHKFDVHLKISVFF